MAADEPIRKRKRSSTRYWVEIKGRIYARLQYRTEAGSYKVKYEPITDKRTARSVVEKMRVSLEKYGEEILRSDKMTFAELADKFEESEVVEAQYQNGVKISGRRSLGPVRSAMKPLRSYFGNKGIHSIKPAAIKNYKSVRLASPVEIEVNETEIKIDETTGKKDTIRHKVLRTRERKVASVNRELTVLKTIFNFAVANEWLVGNPFAKSKGVISTAAEVERDRVLSFEEEGRLLAACVGAKAHIRPILICALDTGMRRGEIFKMRWRDVDLLHNHIVIPQTNTKTEESRVVGMTSRLKRELQNLWDVSPHDPNRTVFGISNTIKNAFASACRDAGLLGFRFHDCRHTATTRMISSGSPHTEVMKITGHSQLTTFLRYLNITRETANSVAGKLEDHIEGRCVSADVASESIN